MPNLPKNALEVFLLRKAITVGHAAEIYALDTPSYSLDL